MPFSRKYEIQLSRDHGAETFLQQSTLDSHSNYKYLELPGINYVHFPKNMCLSCSLAFPLHISPNFFISKLPENMASFFFWHQMTPKHPLGKRLIEDTGNVCPATTWTLHSQNRLSQCRGTAWVFALYLTAPSPKGKELNYIFGPLLSNSLSSNWLNSSKVVWKKGSNTDKNINVFHLHKPANKSEEAWQHYRNILTCYWLIYSSTQLFI